MLSYKFKLYTNKEAEKKLEESLELARLAIQPIAGGNKQGEERRKKNNPEAHTTQALIVSEAEKRREPRTKKGLLQSIANGQLPAMLWNNMKVLLRLKKKNGKKYVG